MKKNNTSSVEEYRQLRKERRKDRKAVIRAHRDKVKAGKKVKASSIKKK